MHFQSKIKQFFFGITFLMLLGATPILAQNGVTVSGTIKDQNDAVVQGATVRLLNLGSSQETTATTDSTGKYEFTNVVSGSYRLSATSEGFAASAQSITIIGDNLTQDFSLSPGAIQDVVTITAGKGDARVAAEVPQTVTVITSEQLEQQRPRSTFEAIERTPNIIVRETNPARERPRLRGLDSSRVLIVIDGERLNNARTDLQTGLSPSIIDVTQLESAEVVSGSGASLYGSDAIAGTINLITRGPDRPDSGVNIGFRLDGNYSSNGEVARGYGVFNISNKMAAFRASYSQFSLVDYNIGNEPITIEQVRTFGDFYLQFPSNNATQYPLFSVPEGGQVFGGGGRGINNQFDLWFYPSEKHNFRGRFINSQHDALGDAFSGPPYEVQERFNLFRNYRKFGARYEGLDLISFVPRVSVNYYNQKLSFPQSQYDYIINPNSSFTGAGNAAVFRNPSSPSTFTIGNFTDNKNTITTDGFEVQATLQPFAGLLVTSGYQYLRDNSQDEFTRFPVVSSADRNPRPNSPIIRGASSPDTSYTDNAFFTQAEFDRIKWFRLSGGFRVDRWSTKARVTPGFPLGLEFLILQRSLPILTQTPGALAEQIPNLQSIVDLAGGLGDVSTSNTSLTGNIGLVLRLPYGINPFIRYANSYREPSLTERYIVRDFLTKPFFASALVVGNPGLEPERGRSLDVGVKVQGSRYNGTFTYFRNDLKDLIVFQTPSTQTNPSGGFFITPDPPGPQRQLLPVPPPPGQTTSPGHSVSFNGRINQAENLISGFEATGEVSIPLGGFGSLNPFTSLGWLRGENKSPTLQQTQFIRDILSRPNNPIEFEGSATDVPLGNITPFRTITGVQFLDSKARFFVEYNFRHQSRVKRFNPTTFLGPTLVNFGTFASLNGFTRHNIRAGYTFRTERARFSFNAGVDNLTGKLYWEQFQNAPAPGRSFVFGFTTELFNLLGNK